MAFEVNNFANMVSLISSKFVGVGKIEDIMSLVCVDNIIAATTKLWIDPADRRSPETVNTPTLTKAKQ